MQQEPEKTQQDRAEARGYPSRAMSNENTVKIKLDYPITANGVTVEEITLRRPTVQDAINSKRNKASDEEAEMKLLASIAGIAPDEFAKLDMADFVEVQKVASGFLSRKKAS